MVVIKELFPKSQAIPGKPSLEILWPKHSRLFTTVRWWESESRWYRGKYAEFSTVKTTNLLDGREKKTAHLAPYYGQSPEACSIQNPTGRPTIYKSEQLGLMMQLSTVSPTERHFLGRNEE